MTTKASAAIPDEAPASPIVRFLAADHRYVFLSTSVVAGIGMWLSSQVRSPWSFLAPFYSFECILYYVLLAFLGLASFALLNKLVSWRDYARTSIFVKEPLKSFVRLYAMLVLGITLIFCIDRIVVSFAFIVAGSVRADANPQGFLPGAIYMVYQGRGVFLRGILATIELALFGTIIAFFLAVLLVFLRTQQIDRPDNDFVRFLKTVGVWFAKFYSAVVRGTPMMVQSLLIYFAGFSILRSGGMTAAEVGALWSTFVAGLVTISLNSTAYMMEVLRGGIEAVDKGQNEAARSLGLSQWQSMTRVVFPQGIKNAIPALSNELVVNIKDSSVLSVIGVFDLMFATTTVAGIYYRQLEVYAVATLCYLVLTMIASRILSALARRMEVPSPGLVLSTSDMIHTQGVAGAQANPRKVEVQALTPEELARKRARAEMKAHMRAAKKAEAQRKKDAQQAQKDAWMHEHTTTQEKKKFLKTAQEKIAHTFKVVDKRNKDAFWEEEK